MEIGLVESYGIQSAIWTDESGGVCGHHLVVYLENFLAESGCLDCVTLKILSGLNRSVPVGSFCW